MLEQSFNTFIKYKYYNRAYNLLLNKIIKVFIKRGNKNKALKFLFNLKYILKKNTNKDANLILLIALLRGLLKVYFIKIRLGGKYKDMPMPLLSERQIRFVVRDFYKFSKSNKSRSISINNLNNLILLTCRKKGSIIKKNYGAYKKAIDNRILLSLRKRRKR